MALGAVLALLALPAQACDAAYAAFREAAASRDLAATIRANDALQEASPACTPEIRAFAGRVTAFAHLPEAGRAQARGDVAEEARVLERGLRYGRPWQVLAARGDVLQRLAPPGGSPDFAAASSSYQDALNDLADSAAETNPARPADIERLHRLAQQTRMLAERTVTPPRTRSGRQGGLSLRQVRTLMVERVALPIQFVFGSDRPTELGSRALEALWSQLDEQGRPPILLLGHTDPVGSDEANMALSERRAIAVGLYLVERGYDRALIQFEGRGESEPLAIEDEARYSQAQIHQMHRRVELVVR